MSALTNLHLVHTVPPVRGPDLASQRPSSEYLTRELPRRRLPSGGANDVGHNAFDVPQRAVGRSRPVLGGQKSKMVGEPLVFHSRDGHGLGVSDSVDGEDIDDGGLSADGYSLGDC